MFAYEVLLLERAIQLQDYVYLVQAQPIVKFAVLRTVKVCEKADTRYLAYCLGFCAVDDPKWNQSLAGNSEK